MVERYTEEQETIEKIITLNSVIEDCKEMIEDGRTSLETIEPRDLFRQQGMIRATREILERLLILKEKNSFSE